MLSLLLYRRPARHAAPRPGPSREMPATPPVPPQFWPVFGWLEARAQGVVMDPEYDAAMTALAAGLEQWQQVQGNE